MNTIKLELIVFALSSKIESLKKTLNDEQRKIFDECMKEQKAKFLEDRKNLSDEEMELVEKHLK